MDIRSCDVYLVGSMAVPSDTVQEAMEIAVERLGERLCALPDGEIPAELRFEVALPTPLAAIMPFFGDPSEWPAMTASYQQAITAELERILAVIGPEELAVQWDYCIELCDICGAARGAYDMSGKIMPWNPRRPAEELFAHHTSPQYIAPLSSGIPDGVVFGYHFCLGTFPAFPTVPVDDLSWVVRIANAVVAATPRRVDFVHLPAMPDSGREYFAPLADLDVAGARVFLGLEQRDGAQAILERGRAAREFLPDFGISHYCGYGRDDRDRIRELLGDLRDGADLLAAERRRV